MAALIKKRTDPVFTENEAAPDALCFEPGTVQRALLLHVGKFVRCQFFTGAPRLSVKEGILESVGWDALTLYDDRAGRRIVCQLHTLRFATVYENGRPAAPAR